MSSQALAQLTSSIDEITQLETLVFAPTTRNWSVSASSRAVGRAATVLLYSHFERYFRSLDAEIVDFVNLCNIPGSRLPEDLRLAHSQLPIDEMAVTQWTNRGPRLTTFSNQEAWLWSLASSGSLVQGRLVSGMKSVAPKALVRYYHCWGIDDVFSAVTRNSRTRGQLWLSLQSLVDKRHAIAHGDAAVETTRADLQQYKHAVSVFSTRADRVISSQLAVLLGVSAPW
jgi:hypothetical protein